MLDLSVDVRVASNFSVFDLQNANTSQIAATVFDDIATEDAGTSTTTIDELVAAARGASVVLQCVALHADTSVFLSLSPDSSYFTPRKGTRVRERQIIGVCNNHVLGVVTVYEPSKRVFLAAVVLVRRECV
ncbi:hypothetical protein HAL_39450 [Haladaptatus sp. T7]|nr:hypothetical protein HAL_39450 [Haladaptatus sp. T7]